MQQAADAASSDAASSYAAMQQAAMQQCSKQQCGKQQCSTQQVASSKSTIHSPSQVSFTAYPMQISASVILHATRNGARAAVTLGHAALCGLHPVPLAIGNDETFTNRTQKLSCLFSLQGGESGTELRFCLSPTGVDVMRKR